MYSYLKDNTACYECVSTEEQREFARNATWGARIAPFTMLIGAWLLAWYALWSGAARPFNATLSGTIAVVVACFSAVRMAEFIHFSLVGRDLYVFTDAFRHVHCEASYPVSVEPGRPRDKDSLAHGPVLRLRSRLFSWSGFVTPLGEERSNVVRAIVTMHGQEPSFRIESPTLRIGGFNRIATALEFMNTAWVTEPDILMDAAPIHNSLVNELSAARACCDALRAERNHLAGQFVTASAKLASFDEKHMATTATLEEYERRIAAIAEDVLTLVTRIIHFRSRRCKESHPGTIREELEGMLEMRFTGEELSAASARLNVSSNPFADALKDVRLSALCSKPGVADAPAKTPPPHNAGADEALGDIGMLKISLS